MDNNYGTGVLTETSDTAEDHRTEADEFPSTKEGFVDFFEWVTLTYRCGEEDIVEDEGVCYIRLDFYELTSVTASIYIVNVDEFELENLGTANGGDAGIEESTNPDGAG